MTYHQHDQNRETGLCSDTCRACLIIKLERDLAEAKTRIEQLEELNWTQE